LIELKSNMVEALNLYFEEKIIRFLKMI